MPFQSTEEIFEAFQRLSVLIVGDVMLDSYLWGAVDRISPEAPVPVVNVKRREQRLGGAGNVIMNIKALGCTPLVCAVIGKDEDGARFKEIMSMREVATEGLVESDDKVTTVKHRILAGSQHILRIDTEDDGALNEKDTEQLLRNVKQMLPKADVLLFQDYDKGVLNKETISSITAMAKKTGIPIAVDPKKRNFLSYEGVDLFKPNLKELREGLGLEVTAGSTKELDAAAIGLEKHLKHKASLITLSEHGVYIRHDDSSTVIPAHKREIADVSGAGDTVISIAAACLGLGLPLEFTAALSNLGGGLVCEHVGVVPINRDDLLAEAEENRLLVRFGHSEVK